MVYEKAKAYMSAGCNCIPVDPKTKKPMVAWARWQRELVPSIELAAMFERTSGIGIVCGEVSGGLEVIDFDNPPVFPLWLALIDDQLSSKLLVQKTQSGGFHVAYRTASVGRNQKLAMQQDKTAIETRGQGGYIIAAPTPGYEIMQGSWESLAEVTDEEREAMMAAARVYDESKKQSSNLRPGDDFMARTSWAQILEPHGWRKCAQKDEVISWTRPGKQTSDGLSATTNHYGDDKLHVFSHNAIPFEGSRSYTKLNAHSLLNYAGDFSAMIKGLRSAGFGDQSSHRAKVVELEHRLYPSIDIGTTKPIENVEFWWQPYLPKGKAVLLDGDSGTRKTTLILSLAAAFSNGIDPVTGNEIPKARTLYFGKEDTPEELGTVYQANHGKPGYMEVYSDTFSLTPDAIYKLALKIEQEEWDIVVFDAYLYFLEGIVRDSNNSIQEIKSVTQALNEIYDATGTSGLHIRHTAKQVTGRSPAAMGVGSYQFRASHRGQLLVRKHPEKDRDIVITDCKGNLLVEQGAMFGVERLGNEMRYYPLEGDPFAEDYQEKEKPKPNNSAIEFITNEMRGGDTKFASDMYALAKEKGVSKSSLHRAVQSLNLTVKKEGARWTWHMPDPFE